MKEVEKINLEIIKKKKELDNNKKEETLRREIRDELLIFFKSESEYTKNHSLFLANECVRIMFRKRPTI
jgi:hypothetical protein